MKNRHSPPDAGGRKTEFILLGLLIGVTLMSLSLTIGLWGTVGDLNDRVEAVEHENQEVKENLDALHTSGTEDETEHIHRSEGTLVAIDTDGSGTTLDFTMQSNLGSGVFIDVSGINHDETVQTSLKDAIEVVDTETPYQPEADGIVFRLNDPPEWDIIGGESAGLTFAIHVAATDPRYEYNESVVATGRITEDGDIRHVQGVSQKTEAAKEDGKELILIPENTAVSNSDPDIEVVEVSTVIEALDYALDETEENTG